MYIEKELSVDELLGQLSAFSLRLDNTFKIISIDGDPSILGISNLKQHTFFLKFLPTSLAEEIEKKLITTLKENKKTQFSVNYTGINNQLRSAQITSSLIDNDGIVGYMLTFLNLPPLDKTIINESNGFESYTEAIRQLKLSEERFAAYFENDPVMHLSVDPITGFIIECNNYTVNKLEFPSKEALIGLPVYTIYTKKNKDRFLFLFEKFKKEGFLKSEEMELQTRTGKKIPVILYTTSERDEHGKIIMSRSTLVDISELKNIQMQLQKEQTNLEFLNNELEQFVSTCSHDLQEPLATIKFASDIVGKLYVDKLDEKGLSYISYIDQAVDRLSNQIKELFIHVKIGKDTKPTKVNTKELIQTVMADLWKRVVETKANIIIYNDLPIIQAYKVELRLLFQNLISNALKYAHPERKLKISINYTECPVYTHFTITDNGIGISKLDCKEIFKIFNKVNADNPNKGTGVGLAHCEKIVRMHLGAIWVESTLGEGSTFNFKLKKQLN